MIRKSLSHYQITSLIGKGGMGEVYQATDTKLGRDVAIKVLPEEFAQDADRVARFQREAKLLASLNHPNIAAIHGLEEADGTHFLVLELVEGQTLAERIKTGPIPVEEALKLGLQIAEALEAAHEKGVIHRDLKPSNIKATPEGKVKVLDFGLAKAFDGKQVDLNLSHSPTLSQAATMQGMILGTAAYMSPEQARGKFVDYRTDIWSFGCVLYEMLTGLQLFKDATVSDTLAAVLTREPEWDRLHPDLHPRIRLLLERCLEKESKDRYGSISDPRVDIQNVLADPSGILTMSFLTPKPQGKLRLVLLWAATTGFFILIALLVGLNIRSHDAKIPHHFPLELGLGSNIGMNITSPAPLVLISPDGSQIIGGKSATDGRTELIDLTDMNPLHIPIPSLPVHSSVAFSPNGEWIAFRSTSLRSGSTTLNKIRVTGGKVMPLWSGESLYGGVTWEKNGTLLFCQSGNVLRISQDGGNPETLLKLPEGEICSSPQILPGGKWILFSITTENQPNPWTTAQIAVQSLTSDERHILSTTGISPRYVPTGHVVYILSDSLYGIPFNLKTMQTQGSATQILDGVRTTDATADYSFSDTGSLLYLTGGTVDTATTPSHSDKLVVFDRQGNPVSSPLSDESREYVDTRLAPNRNQIAASVRKSVGNTFTSHIWIYDIANGYSRQFTYGNEAQHVHPVWTADSKFIIYMSYTDDGMDIFRKATNFSGEAELMYSLHKGFSFLDVSLDKALILSTGGLLAFTPQSQGDIWTLPPGSEGTLSEFLASPIPEVAPRFSPDGKWVAYMANELDEPGIYVRPYPKTEGDPIPISSGIGTFPIWSPDGKKLFYIAIEKKDVPGSTSLNLDYQNCSVMEVKVWTEPTFKCDPPVKLFKINQFPVVAFDIMPGGDRFILSQRDTTTSSMPLSNMPKAYLITNWFEELKEKVPVN